MAKGSDLPFFTKSMAAITNMYKQNIICSKTHLNSITPEQTLTNL